VADVVILTWIGGIPVEHPYIIVGQIASLIYFSIFLVLAPIAGLVENKIIE